MDETLLGRAIGFLLIPLFWVVALTVPLWLIRRFAPSAEFWLYSPLLTVIRRLAALARQGYRAGYRYDRAAPVRSARHPASRD